MSEIEIIFEDEDLLVVNKPAGWSMARQAKAGAGGTHLVTALAAMGWPEVIPAHRLDEAVSGLAVLARNKSALDFLSGEFQSKQAERLYRGLAVVATAEEAERISPVPMVRDEAGRLPAEFTVRYGLGPDREVPGRMHVYRKKGGRPAFTRVRVREDFGRFVWFEAWPETSRQMQVAAHMAAVGAPVLGDGWHGLPEVELRLSGLKRGYKGKAEERPLVEGLALQAAGLSLRHPVTRARVEWALPEPKAMAIALKNLRKFSRR